ncbi:hypothetical protein M128_0856 [Bacteroides fragilis str. S6L8]|nr:hypothetical protein M128_0856 [Bacteroides fragilis str. S6L8]
MDRKRIISHSVFMKDHFRTDKTFVRWYMRNICMPHFTGHNGTIEMKAFQDIPACRSGFRNETFFLVRSSII